MRMTAEQALRHPWFQMTNLTSETCASLAGTQAELKKNYRKVFKSAVNAIKSINRVSLLAGRPTADLSAVTDTAIASKDEATLSSAGEDSLSAGEKAELEKNASKYAQFGK